MTHRLVGTAPSLRIEIYMAGPIEAATDLIQGYCDAVGMCVTVEPVDYVYTGGREPGFRIGFINYPRFPADEETIRQHAHALADGLAKDLEQTSFSIVTPSGTQWFSMDPAACQETPRPFRPWTAWNFVNQRERS